MNRLAIASLLAATALGATGVQAQAFVDNARVRSAEPQYENVAVPRTECRSEWVREDRRSAAGQNGYGGAVLGGVAGALLGNRVGGGHGREAATAVGAVMGAFAGDQFANGDRRDRWDRGDEAREVKRCWTVNDVQPRITGYRVNYDYHGQNYSTLLRENPGPVLQVRVTVDPVQRY
ncbi:MAG: glycine zipper 2TM domain-containing protein [Ramlibacter sp.]|nr:glycine zipper 2TM domain-containing protein [Ramlibacter sp.]